MLVSQSEALAQGTGQMRLCVINVKVEIKAICLMTGPCLIAIGALLTEMFFVQGAMAQ